MQPSQIAGAAGTIAAGGGALSRRRLGGPKPMTSAVGGALGAAGGSAPSAPPDASAVAAKLPGLPGFRLSRTSPWNAPGSSSPGGPPAPMFADKVGRMTTGMPDSPPGSEAAIQDFMKQNPGLTEDFIRNAAGGGAPSAPPQPPLQVQGRDLNADGVSITGANGGRQELGTAALRRLGQPSRSPVRGTAPDADADMVSKRLPPGLKGFRTAQPPMIKDAFGNMRVDPEGGLMSPSPGQAAEWEAKFQDLRSRGVDVNGNPVRGFSGPTDEVARELDGLKPMVADEPPMEFAPPRQGGGGRMGRRRQGY